MFSEIFIDETIQLIDNSAQIGKNFTQFPQDLLIFTNISDLNDLEKLS